MKQETLEEVALEFAKDHHEMYETSNFGSMHFGFCWGAKWQQQNSYSEEEVNEIIAEAWNSCEDNEGETFTEARKRILEQFKKK